MKAHIPIDRRTRREIDRVCRIQINHERDHMTRRVFKLLVYVLNTEFGFGVTRLKRVVDKIGETLQEQDDNPVFWRQVDHHVIEYLKIPFDFEQTDIDGNLIDD